MLVAHSMKYLFRLIFRMGFGCLVLGVPIARAQMPFFGNYFLHDPSTMIKAGSSYFIYGDGQGISGIASTDLRNWSATPAVFPSGPPAWTVNDLPAFTNVVAGVTNITPAFSGYFWAPDIAYFSGSYHLYYACSQWGTRNSAIGVATSPSLSSPSWTD
jgi:arabinan endo-1,5-alpha-L-arabinosidase